MTKAVKTTGKILDFNKEYSFFVKRGDSKRVKNNSIDALSMYIEALERNPYDCDTRITVAEMLTAMGRFIESNNVIIPYMHSDDRLSVYGYYIVGFNFMGMGWYFGANNCFNTFLDLTKGEISEQTETAWDAIDAITQSVDNLDSDITDATKVSIINMCNVAKHLVYKERVKEAQVIVDTLVEKHPKDSEVRRTAAWVYFCLSDISTAVSHLNMALKRDPNDIQALCMYICFSADNIELEEVESICDRISKYTGEDLNIAIRICEALLVAEHTEQATQLAKRMYAVSPYECETAHLLAQCYVCSNELRKAVSIYDKLLRINKNDVIARYYRQLYSSCEDSGSEGIVSARYVLPMNKLINEASRILELSKKVSDEFAREWQNDPSLEEYALILINIGNTELGSSIFRAVSKLGIDLTERFMRRILISDFIAPSIKEEVLAELNNSKAKEPFYVISEQVLHEGRVRVMSDDFANLPMQYANIYVRFMQMMLYIYDEEVLDVAVDIFSRFISATEFPTITEAQSAALSAAVVYLSCDKCGATFKSEILQSYDITQRRLLNAVRRINETICKSEDSSE